MLQGGSVYKSPANGVQDNSEVLTFETDVDRRRFDITVGERFPKPALKVLTSTMPVRELACHYKGMIYTSHCERMNENPFDTSFADIFWSSGMKTLTNSFEKLGTHVLAKFDYEIGRIYKTLRTITAEMKKIEEESATVREMIQFMMPNNAESSKAFKERLAIFEIEVDIVYNVVLDKLNRITGEWEELPNLDVSEAERDILHQQLAEKQKAFERLFMRSVAFRSSAKLLRHDISEDCKSPRVVEPILMRDFTTITIMPEYTHLSLKVTEFWSNTRALFKKDRDGILCERTAHLLLEDITVLSTMQLNYTTKLLCLSKRACEAEHAKKTELQNLYKLHSNIVVKENMVEKCSGELDKLEVQLLDHKIELDECMVSKFDDVIEIKQFV